MHSSWVIDTTLYLLTFMSFLSWSIFIAKTLAAWRSQRATAQYLATQWQSPRWETLSDATHAQDSDLAKLSHAGMSICHECTHGQYGTEELYTLVSAGLGQEIKQLTRERESWLGVLASVSSIAPFVGLFGTVWGIMHALVVIGETGQATIAVVAGPIGEALIATAIGIATAVPALIFYNVLMRNTRLHVTQLEAFAERFLRLALKHRGKWSGA
ncbi:biopolymer transporter ExbB [Limnohabitans sp. MORI2]|uniref:MotA/TolQ/ExbB proton channel family protein n=1 Tax=Limnohabitans sp. MORI2 TaxID=1751150 RepID=UPI002376D20F|nr:MotA/TolQ/ExbB proton channel family protein [Limnohabitans sp. MORI2]BDU58803.1 biopolymer transporter ExbB [Limnohabitans sp. MORI2]